MPRLITSLDQALVAALLNDYFSEVNEFFGAVMHGDVSVDHIEDALFDLEQEYAKKIVKELK